MRNPFTPTFGAPPPLLVGRRDLLDQYEDSLADGPGSPGYATLFTGGRGVGKTVMLNAAEDIARDAGFAVVSETATAGLIDRLTSHHLPALLPATRRRVQAIEVPAIGGGLTLEGSASQPALLRSLVEQATMKRPVLITIDEIHSASLPEMRNLATVLQHAIRESRPLAFCGAGLPSAVDAVSNDDVLTFLRRAERHLLGAVRLPDVAAAFTQVIIENGRTIDVSDAAAAAASTGGYPFMIQLVGYHTWRAAQTSDHISAGHILAGAEAAQRRVGRLVIEPALNDLSAVDRTFLLKMAADDAPSKMADIAERMGVDANYAGQYRLRLISAGLIVTARRGHVDYALPGLRNWLRDHAAFDV